MSEERTIARVFGNMFARWDRRLPRDYIQRGRGHVIGRAWTIQYLVGRDDKGLFADVYARHRMTNDQHTRIRGDGTTEELPALLDMILMPLGITDKEREGRYQSWDEHNEVAAVIMKSKGFDL